jgi:hypothetical protein
MATTLDSSNKYSGLSLSNGNLTATTDGAYNYESVRATNYKSSGKFYFEVTATSLAYLFIGICNATYSNTTLGNHPGVDTNGYGYWSYGYYYYNNSSIGTVPPSYVSGDKIMVAYDMTAGYIWWGKNGTWTNSGNPATGANPIFTGLTGNMYPCISNYASAVGYNATINFGNTAFAYTVPSGFSAFDSAATTLLISVADCVAPGEIIG